MRLIIVQGLALLSMLSFSHYALKGKDVTSVKLLQFAARWIATETNQVGARLIRHAVHRGCKPSNNAINGFVNADDSEAASEPQFSIRFSAIERRDRVGNRMFVG